jgi:hypothetical protein
VLRRRRIEVGRALCCLAAAGWPRDDAEAAAPETKLVLILANHIGELDVLNEAVAFPKVPANSH